MDLYVKIRSGIADVGQFVIAVGGEKDDPPFAYTIGNVERRLPELLLIGLATEAHWLLNELSKMMRERGGAFADGELVSVGGEFPVKVIAASDQAQTDYTIQVERYYGVGQYPVHQVLICDKAGKYPGDTGCAEPYASIPVLKAVRH